MHRLLIVFLFACGSLSAQQPIDSAYTARIRELTPTDPNWKFSTELVDYLPASATVPTPLKILGYVPGMGERTIRRGRTSGPHAFMIPRGQRRAAEAAELVNLFRTHGTEVHAATADFSLAPGERRAGAECRRKLEYAEVKPSAEG